MLYSRTFCLSFSLQLGLFFFLLFRATPTAYGDSQARDPTQDPSRIYDLHRSSQQCQILNPLIEARDRTHNLMVPSWIHFRCTKMETPSLQFCNPIKDFQDE